MKFFFLLFFFSSMVWAHEHSAEKTGIGPHKGVLEADEDQGFVLRESVEVNFAIKKQQLPSGTSWVIPRTALVYSGLETQIFRQRGAYWKAIDVVLVKKGERLVELRSENLGKGDRIAIEGVGFLKVIEQSVFGPETSGHDH